MLAIANHEQHQLAKNQKNGASSRLHRFFMD